MATAILRACRDYDVPRIEALLREALETLDIPALRPGAKVLLKPNLLMRREPDRHTTTHPAVVEALAHLLFERGCLITIADSPGGPFTPGLLRSLYESTGMERAARRAGAELNFSTESVDVEVPAPLRTHMLNVLRCAAEADCIVSVGKIKTHGLTAYTGAVKNLFGLIPGLRKVDCHARFPDIEDFSRLLLDVAAWARPALSVLDGIVGMEGKGPSSGSPRQIGALVVADDPHAADVVGASLIGLSVEDVPTLRLARENGRLPVPLVLGQSVEELAVPDFRKAPVETARRGILTDRRFARLVRSHPFVHAETCAGCGLCARACPAKAIELRRGTPAFDLSRCIRCYCCQELCPHSAVDVHEPFFTKWLS